ncbi:hypothetical protein [Burkholderia ubonensis]|uniref:hypothetical protein n=1 Tax=Burkholderia ubonensis TaxID=101571 RepID=UPI002ABE4AC2|nr:hypothetical protein [Burkholderia ubonensis]
MIAEDRARGDLDQRHDPQPVNQARLCPAMRGRHQHHHAGVKLVRIAFDAFEWGKRRPARTVAGARLAHRLGTADQFTRSRGMLGEHAVDVAGERHVAALFDVERPFVAALEPACAQLGEKPAEHCHPRPARRLELGPLAENLLAQSIFEPTARGRLEHPLQRTHRSAAPRIELERRSSLVGLDAHVRQQATPTLDPTIGMRPQTALGQQSIRLAAAHAAGRFDLCVGRAVEI